VTPAPGRSAPEPGGRRLALTPVSLDVVAALAHDPEGLRLTPLAHAIGSPVSSVQAALRILLANELVHRDGEVPPRYSLPDHPARPALIDLSILLPEPAHVLAVALRASPATVYAAVDRAGFVAGLDPDAEEGTRDRLLTTIRSVQAARGDTPPIDISPIEELVRMTGVSVGLRARLGSAVALKGRLPGRRGTAGATQTGVSTALPVD